ncbi:MAG TPA: hypothetical protein P5514_09100, partial [Bacteroidales bacterium]|nr:hypothetical protein [Bacteroidales bacterium]
NNNLPLFVDGSCRREPDFQNPFPAITQLCRPGKLVPRLNIGDLVIYITRSGFYGLSYSHWKFIGILEVIEIANDHLAAVPFYQTKQIPISQNIFCHQTSPNPLNLTHGKCGFQHKDFTPQQIVSLWNKGYIGRAKDHPQIVITKVWNDSLNINNPPIITHVMMQNIFGRIPGTQNPPAISQNEWINFRNVMNI